MFAAGPHKKTLFIPLGSSREEEVRRLMEMGCDHPELPACLRHPETSDIRGLATLIDDHSAIFKYFLIDDFYLALSGNPFDMAEQIYAMKRLTVEHNITIVISANGSREGLRDIDERLAWSTSRVPGQWSLDSLGLPSAFGYAADIIIGLYKGPDNLIHISWPKHRFRSAPPEPTFFKMAAGRLTDEQSYPPPPGTVRRSFKPSSRGSGVLKKNMFRRTFE